MAVTKQNSNSIRRQYRPADIRRIFSAQVQDHLDWFANEGKYAGCGFSAEVEKHGEAVGGNIWNKLYGRRFRDMDDPSIPKAIKPVIGSDFEFLVGATKDGKPTATTEAHIDYVVQGRKKALFTYLHKTCGAMFDVDDPAFCNTPDFAAFDAELEKIMRGGYDDLPSIRDEIRKWPTLRYDNYEGQDHDDLKDNNPKTPLIHELILQKFFGGTEQGYLTARKNNNTYNYLSFNTLKNRIDEIVYSFAGDFINFDIRTELTEASRQNPEVFQYLEEKTTTDGRIVVGYDERDGGRYKNEARFSPTFANPNSAYTGEEMPSGPFLTKDSSMQACINDFMKRVKEKAKELGTEARFLRAHVHFSAKDGKTEDNLFVRNDDIHLTLNPLAQAFQAGVLAVTKMLGKRNPCVDDDAVVAAPRYGVNRTNIEFRDLLSQEQFTRDYPELVRAGITAFDWSLLETLGGKRLGIKMMKHFIPVLKGHGRWDCADIISYMPDSKFKDSIGPNFQADIYGAELLEAIQEKRYGHYR